jgi:sulfoxide reductase heme-binding subunit YedZ
LLLAASLVVLAVGAWRAPYPEVWERISVVSAWLCLGLLAWALLIGPLQCIQGVKPPFNIYLRRDVGIWAALHGLLHFYAGNVVAMNSVYVAAFVQTPTPELGIAIRDLLFSYGATVGMVIAILFLLLLAISSDRALRWLGPKKWKWLQRSAHVSLWLTVTHGIAYQLLEMRIWPLVATVLVSVWIIVVQVRGRRAKALLKDC